MLKHRIIPTLLLHNSGLVKTFKFQTAKYVGDPVNAIHIFNEKEIDELMVLDISASKQEREPNYQLIEEIASECFIPLAYGGGVRTIEQAARLFSLGVEKICLQTAVLKDINIVSIFAEHFGCQSVVVSVDVKRNFFGRLKLYSAVQRHTLPEPWLEFVQRAQAAGAGEIIVNAVHQDGTLNGPDLKMIQEAAAVLSIPLVAAGGISSLSDIKAAMDAGANAVAAGAFFVFHGPHRAVLITYPKYQELENLFKANQ